MHRNEVSLPDSSLLEREQLAIHSDFYLPRKHRLISELVARRGDICRQLMIPVSDEPINVFLFEKELDYRRFMRQTHPEFPVRRAFLSRTIRH